MRREIRALEAQGVGVVRAAARRFGGPLVDRADLEEQSTTHYLTGSMWNAALWFGVVALTRPIRLLRALLDALTIGSGTRIGAWKYLMYVGEACVLLRLTRCCRHIHANFSNALSISVMCRILGGPQVSLRIHGPEEFDYFSPRQWMWMSSHAAFICPISDHGTARVKGILGPGDAEKVRTLRCGVDAVFLAPETTPPASAYRIVNVARLETRKGHRILLDAIGLLRDRGIAASLTIVGDGALRTALEDRAKFLGLEDRITFNGWGDGLRVREEIQGARLFVLPSYAEGLPIVIMEAFALGRSVVATNVDGIPELVVPGRTGWLVRSGSAAELADALAMALTAPDETLREFAREGRRLVETHHSADRLMGQLIAWMGTTG